MKKIILTLLGLICIITINAQKKESTKAYKVTKIDSMIHVSSIASRPHDLIPIDMTPREAKDKKSRSNKLTIPNDPQKTNDYFTLNRNKLEQKIKGRMPSLVFDAASSTSQPTDPALAVGPNHVMVVFNTGFRIFDKSGNPLTGQLAPSPAIFPSSGCCDLTASYDNLADRWVLSFLHTSNGAQVAVSDGPDPVNDGWYVYNVSAITDYQKLSVWRDGYYLTENTSNSNKVHALERDKMLLGDNSAQILSFNLPGIITNGFHAPQVLNISDDTHPSSGGATIVYMQDDAWGAAQDHIKIWTLDMDWNTPANSMMSASQTINTTPFISVFDSGSFSNLQQPSGGTVIDALQATIMNQAQFRKFPTYNSALFNFVVDTDASANKLAGIRWVELRQVNDTAPWTLYQEGTYTAANGKHAWNASLIMDSEGNIGMGYTGMGGTNNKYVGMYYTGRYASDPLGTMSIAEEILLEGNANIPGTRYGDYSKIDVDPSDDKTFWFADEIMNSGRKDVVGVFKIAPSGANDVGVVSIESPSSGVLTNSEQVTVTLFNYGTSPQSNIPLTLSVDGVNVANETYTGTLASLNSIEYTFTTTVDLSNSGQTYTIVAATDLTGDLDTNNDSSTANVTNQPENCGLSLNIPDASCTSSNQFPINITTAPGNTLGTSVFVESVRLIIEHTYDADLDIHLTSPNGVTVLLSSDNGGSGDNYGDPTDILCNNYTEFNMSGTDGRIRNGSAPFIGSYIPEGNLTNFEDGSSPIGTWTLQVCDDAGADVGTLEFYEIVFSTASLCSGSTKTWSSGAWDGGGSAPTVNDLVVIQDDYDTAVHGDLNACSLQIDESNEIHVRSGNYLNIINNIVNNGTITVYNEGAVVQTNDDSNVEGSGIYNVLVSTTNLDDANRYTYFSSPTEDETLATFNSWANTSSMYAFDNSTQLWGLANGSTAMNPGSGYAIKGNSSLSYPTQAQTQFNGAFNNGIISQTVFSNVGGQEPQATDDDSNLLGNPYPSSINADKLLTANSNLGAFYFWTHASPLGNDGNFPLSDYAVWTLGTGTLSKTVNIASGQGFFATANTSGTINFDNSMRSTLNNDDFRIATNESKIWLNLTNVVTDNFNQIAVAFTDNGSNGFDHQYDALTYNENFALNFYSLGNNNEHLVINAKPTLDFGQEIIPLGININDAEISNLKISIDHFENFEDTQIYLRDNLSNTIHDLKLNDYTFSVDQTGLLHNRFELIFYRETLGNYDEIDVNNLIIMPLNETDIKIIFKGNTDITNVKIYNILGKLLVNNDINNSEIVINATNLDKILLFKIRLKNGKTLTKKFVN